MRARLPAGRRRARQYAEAAVLFADTGVSGSQTCDLAATALYGKAMDLERRGRREEAIAAYLELLSRYSVVSTGQPGDREPQVTERVHRHQSGSPGMSGTCVAG